jgi:hypothetical protein
MALDSPYIGHVVRKQIYCQVDDVRQNTEPMSLILCSN